MKPSFYLAILVAAFFSCSATFCRAAAPPVLWVQQSVSSNQVYGFGSALDGATNIYVVGQFANGPVAFGGTVLTGSGGFVAKYDSLGCVTWATNAGDVQGQSGSYNTDVATDGAGNVYIAGNFGNRATFGHITITNNTGLQAGFVAKSDGGGNFLWAKTLKATGSLLLYGMASDSDGNCYATGRYNGDAIFGTNLLNGAGFIAKFDSSGNLLWATPAGGGGFGVALDGTGNIFVAGGFSGTASWGSGSTQSNLTGNAIGGNMSLAKYNNAGNLIWVSTSTNAFSFTGAGTPVVCGSDGSAYIAVLQYPLIDSFVCKYSAAGNLMWLKIATNTRLSSIAVDSSNYVYVAGLNQLPSYRTSNFLGKYDSSGNLQWTNGYGEAGSYGFPSMAVDSRGKNIYLTGAFANTVTFGNFTLTTSTNRYGFFLADLGAGLLVRVDGYPPAGTNIVKRGPVTITLETSFDNGIIGYSLDGSDPRISSTLYTGPFTASESALLRAVAYNSTFTDSVEMDAVQITILPTLTVNTAGGGTVRIDPPSGPYFSNSIAQITAQPASGYSFLQWLGDASGTNSTNTVTMSRDKYVNAVFGTAVGTIVVGGGSVSADPSLPLYPFGTTIRLTAQPQAGSYFLQWGAAASGTNNPLNFVVSTATQSVAGVFSPLAGGKFALTVIENGRGHVTRNPPANVYNGGQSVTNTAMPEAGQDFVGWSGDASGTQNPLLVTMNQSKVITANFTKRPSLRVGTPLEGFVEDGFRLTLTGEFGTQYQILGSTNLLDWLPIGTATNTYGTVQFTDGAATNLPARFYRAVKE